MNDLFKADLEALWRKSLCFFLFIVIILNAEAQIEKSYFTYDTTWIVPIETSNVLVNFNLPLEVTVDDEGDAAYMFLDIQQDKRTIHILEVSTTTGISKIHDIIYDKKN